MFRCDFIWLILLWRLDLVVGLDMDVGLIVLCEFWFIICCLCNLVLACLVVFSLVYLDCLVLRVCLGVVLN